MTESIIAKPKKTFSDLIKKRITQHIKQLHGDDPRDLYNFIIGEVEKPLFEVVMEHCNNNQTKAAKCLGMSRSTLRKKLSEFN